MSFGRPDLLWLVLLAPVFAALLAWLWRRRLAADAAWASPSLWDRLLAGYSRHRLVASVTLLAVAVLATTLALARPRWGSESQEVERRGVDVVFVVDSSLSMAARDVNPSRLGVARTLVRRLVRDMPENRVALVQAQQYGQVMAPLTLDGSLLDLLLDAVEEGSLPSPGTELAPALATALELFAETRREHRVVVLLTDGEDHGGRMSAMMDRLREEGVAVHAIGIGTPQGAPIPLPRDPREREGPAYKRDADGDVVITHLEESMLEELAATTGGVYLRATSAAVDLEPVEERIRAMATRTLESEVVNTLEERFQWPLALAAVALLLHLGASAYRPSPTTGRAP